MGMIKKNKQFLCHNLYNLKNFIKECTEFAVKNTKFKKITTNSTIKNKISKISNKRKKNMGNISNQIIALKQYIINLTKHLKRNPKDNQTKRGLIFLITKKRRLSNYLYLKKK